MNFKSKFPSRCERCGQPGHWAGDCDLDTWKAHLSLLHVLTDLWASGDISISEKRHAVSDENRRYYGPRCRSALTWPG